MLSEVPDEKRNVLGPLPQRRHEDWENVQSVEKIGTERLGVDHGVQIAVGRGNEPRVGMEGPGAAQPFELAFLQDAQKLGL